MDEQHGFTLVKAIGRANNDTIGVFAIEARFGDNMSHGENLRQRVRKRTSQTVDANPDGRPDNGLPFFFNFSVIRTGRRSCRLTARHHRPNNQRLRKSTPVLLPEIRMPLMTSSIDTFSG